MDNLDDIRTMNDLRPAGYWKARIGELCDRVEELEKENEAMTKERDDRENAQEASPAPRSATEAPASDIWRCRCGWSGSEPDEHPAYAAAYEPNRQLPAPLCPACGRYFMASEFPLDLDSIRRAAVEGRPLDPRVILALCDEVEETRAALDDWMNGDALHDLIGQLREARPVMAAARAWADAIEGQDIREIERCANELIVAIAACS